MIYDGRILAVLVVVINTKEIAMETDYANQILQRMARERNTTVYGVIQEYLKYQVNGQAKHFWPDENEACRFHLENG